MRADQEPENEGKESDAADRLAVGKMIPADSEIAVVVFLRQTGKRAKRIQINHPSGSNEIIL